MLDDSSLLLKMKDEKIVLSDKQNLLCLSDEKNIFCQERKPLVKEQKEIEPDDFDDSPDVL